MKTNISSYLNVYLISIAWLLIGCGPSLQVYTDYDRSANMDTYQTFGWIPSTDIETRNNPIYYNELNDKRIKNAVATQLESRHYHYSEKPEMLIHYHIIIDDKTIVRTDPYGYYYGPYWMRTHVNIYEYREGTLIIDIMDAATNSLVWRGWATSFLKDKDPEKIEVSIADAVRMIFSKYPYHASTREQEIDIQD